jgi:hypothetical protein
VYRGSETCSHWRQLASGQLDGELSEFELTGLERHQAACADCAAWTREVGYIADAIRMSEQAEPREWVAVGRLRARRLPALAAASASIGAAVLAAIAVGLPARIGLIRAQAGAASFQRASAADPPPRSLVLLSLRRAARPAPDEAATRFRPQGPQP